MGHSQMSRRPATGAPARVTTPSSGGQAELVDTPPSLEHLARNPGRPRHPMGRHEPKARQGEASDVDGATGGADILQTASLSETSLASKSASACNRCVGRFGSCAAPLPKPLQTAVFWPSASVLRWALTPPLWVTGRWYEPATIVRFGDWPCAGGSGPRLSRSRGPAGGMGDDARRSERLGRAYQSRRGRIEGASLRAPCRPHRPTSTITREPPIEPPDRPAALKCDAAASSRVRGPGEA
jgi:hypothetical protein